MNTPAIEPQLGIPEVLVAWEPSEHPVITCYVDWRVSGRGLHEAQTVVRKDLHTAQALLPTRGPARESFDADLERITAFLSDEALPSATGYAIYACHGRGLWWTVALGVPVETAVHSGERPRLLPIAEATQEAVRTLAALVDTNAARLIRLDRGGTHEEPGPQRAQWKTVHHSQLGGWSEANYQRSQDTIVERFALDIAETIAAEMAANHLDHLVIAGDEVITGPLRGALPPQLNERVEALTHLDIRTPLDAIADRVWPEARASAAAAREHDIARLIGLAADGRAVAEPTDVRTQLSAGLVDTIAFDPGNTEDDAAELLLREALLHRSRVIVARSHEALDAIGGMVASLRGTH
ncbi:MAG: host attachment protein [Chloroflexi bacterium]|nr:host attachment protein [Chloroflexota bacterium]MDA1145244.1 host attachment protein [Chloroflexota bacterium]